MMMRNVGGRSSVRVLVGQWVVSALIAVTSTGSYSFDLKGLKLGEATTAEEVEQRLNVDCKGVGDQACDESSLKIYERLRVSCGSGIQDMTVCNGWTTVAGFRAEANVVIGATSRLQRIMLTVDSGNFDPIAQDLVRKFGKPTSRRRGVVSNAFGAEFQQDTYIWSDKRGRTVHFERYGASLSRSTIYFSTPEDRALLSSTSSEDDL